MYAYVRYATHVTTLVKKRKGFFFFAYKLARGVLPREERISSMLCLEAFMVLVSKIGESALNLDELVHEKGKIERKKDILTSVRSVPLGRWSQRLADTIHHRWSRSLPVTFKPILSRERAKRRRIFMGIIREHAPPSTPNQPSSLIGKREASCLSGASCSWCFRHPPRYE
jgi:hypothetical protein